MIDRQQATSEFVSVGAAKLSTESAGVGPPIVFLHAAIADRRMWRHQFDALSLSYHTIAFDRRGFGESLDVDETYSQTVDLFAVIDQLVGCDKPVILVGCSQGGRIAIDAAIASPDRVAALVLISPSISGAPVPTPHTAVRRLLEEIDIASQSDDVLQVNRLKARLFLDGALADEDRVKGPARQLFLTMNAVALAAQGHGRVIQPAPAWGRLKQIAMRVHILCGDLDIPHIQERCRQLVAALANARLEMLPGVAHLPSLEQPENLTLRLSKLLTELKYT